MGRRLGGSWLAVVGAMLLVVACGASSSRDNSDGDSTGNAGQSGSAGSAGQSGGGECEPGDEQPAGDGCNTCTCSDEGEWACTELDCECTTGEMRPAGDGCNTCICGDGEWACTDVACECAAGEMRPAGDGCNTCTCSDEGEWACTELDCECTTGEVRPAGDGCNSCVCAEDEWICTNVACPMPCTLGEERMEGCNHCVCGDFGDGPIWSCTADQCCDPGDVRSPDNGCNSCTCDMGGTWQCTDRTCEPCEFIGETVDVGDDCNTCRCEVFGWDCTTIDCTDIRCPAGTANCDGDAATGCETNTDTSVMNCGRCGHYCAIAGAYAACVEGKCVIDHCQSGYEDCNGDVNDGCEARVTNGCDNRCALPSGAPSGTRSMGNCACPMGTACVRDSVMFPDEEYCFPLPETCQGFGRCDCLGVCVCADATAGICYDQMSIGGVFIINCNGQM